MANGRTLTKTRTQTSTRTATAVALGTVGMAAIAAAALALNFRDMSALTPRTPASSGGSTAPRAPIALNTGIAVNLPRPTVGTVPTPPAAVIPLSAASCHSNPKNFPDLTLGTTEVQSPVAGATRRGVIVQVLNNSDKTAGAFALKCLEKLPSGTWQDVPAYPLSGLEAHRQLTQNVEVSVTAMSLQCFVDSSDQVVETNECNNIKDWNIELMY